MDSRELTCKLSGLELDSGGGRSNDSGVASPSDQSSEGAGLSKSRTQSGGEGDQGIGGSEQGEPNDNTSYDT